MATISIASCFCGPPASANGGYFAGRVGNLAPETMTVRLIKPPPLETEMQVAELAEGVIEVRHGDEVIAQARPGELDLVPPPPPTYLEAVDASRHYYGFTHHPFPGCFVCGPARERGDGLRIFAGAVAQRAIVAAPWVPEPFLDRGDGKVKPEFMTAALDCPGYAAVTRGRDDAARRDHRAHRPMCPYRRALHRRRVEDQLEWPQACCGNRGVRRRRRAVRGAPRRSGSSRLSRNDSPDLPDPRISEVCGHRGEMH